MCGQVQLAELPLLGLAQKQVVLLLKVEGVAEPVVLRLAVSWLLSREHS